jgi:cell wall-associated NlpC family hydrolase
MSPTSRSRLFTYVLFGAVLVGAAIPPGAFAGTAAPDAPPRGERATYDGPALPTRGERAVKVALGVVGVPYRWGGESPASGFDCSGLVRWAYGRVGVDLPHNSYALYGEGRRVRSDDMEPGDILFFEGLGHVGLYLGDGRMVHAPQTGRNVEVVRLGTTNYGARLVGARRVTAA